LPAIIPKNPIKTDNRMLPDKTEPSTELNERQLADQLNKLKSLEDELNRLTILEHPVEIKNICGNIIDIKKSLAKFYTPK
jgi:hypothetical protein